MNYELRIDSPLLNEKDFSFFELFFVGFLAAGDKYLTVFQLVEKVVLTTVVELGENVVEKDDGLLAHALPEHSRLRQLEREDGAALLSL